MGNSIVKNPRRVYSQQGGGGGTIDGSGTSNQITYWVDSNTVGALTTATYPSLTELSYIKGLTSAIQTQLDNRNTNIFKNNVQTDHTGTTSETLVLSYDVTGKFAANDLLMFASRVLGNATGNNKTVRIKVNTSASLVGASTLATYTFTSTSVLMQRNFWFANSLANIRVMTNTTSLANDGASSFAGTNINTITHDFTGNTFILISCELAVNTDTISIFATELNRKR